MNGIATNTFRTCFFHWNFRNSHAFDSENLLAWDMLQMHFSLKQYQTVKNQHVFSILFAIHFCSFRFLCVFFSLVCFCLFHALKFPFLFSLGGFSLTWKVFREVVLCSSVSVFVCFCFCNWVKCKKYRKCNWERTSQANTNTHFTHSFIAKCAEMVKMWKGRVFIGKITSMPQKFVKYDASELAHCSPFGCIRSEFHKTWDTYNTQFSFSSSFSSFLSKWPQHEHTPTGPKKWMSDWTFRVRKWDGDECTFSIQVKLPFIDVIFSFFFLFFLSLSISSDHVPFISSAGNRIQKCNVFIYVQQQSKRLYSSFIFFYFLFFFFYSLNIFELVCLFIDSISSTFVGTVSLGCVSTAIHLFNRWLDCERCSSFTHEYFVLNGIPLYPRQFFFLLFLFFFFSSFFHS